MPAPLPPRTDPDERPPDRAPRDRVPPEPPRRGFRLPLWYMLGAVLLILLIQWAASGMRYEQITYGRFRSLLEADQIQSVELSPGKVRGRFKQAETEKGMQGFVANRPVGDDDLIKVLQAKLGDNWDAKTSWLDSPLIYWLIPLVVLFVLWRAMLGRASPMSSVMDFSQSRANVIAQKDVDVTFDDVAGIDECKQELEEVVEFLKNPSKFTRLGGRIPKGVLLIGPPGTGKTLLARAVAGEAGVTFFSLSGSDFVEMFVGVGAARVRDLFDQASKSAPAIIFIDELDALGKKRGTGLMGGHDEREQTLNALLVQMDGFTAQKGVILLAATNRPEMLDAALLRPGRFDRHVVVPPPDLRDRHAILKVHTEDVKLGPNVDLQKLAAMTPGFVGADLANLVNEATLLAARLGKNQVEMADFEDSIERVVAGLAKRNRLMNEEEKGIVAHHEAGHALVACMLPGADRVRKVSMIPRGIAALGYTMQMPSEDRYLLKKNELADRLAVMMGGRSAEEVVFGEMSTGAQNDLQKATELARQMVTEFGMSEEIGPLSYGHPEAVPWVPESVTRGPWSEQTARDVDRAVRALVEDAHKRAVTLLTEQRPALEAIASALREQEVVGEDELEAILAEHGITVAQADPGPAERDAEEKAARTEGAADDLTGKAPAGVDVSERPASA
jgi:cell division protease FtsH